MKFYITNFWGNVSIKSNWIKSEYKFWTIYVSTQVGVHGCQQYEIFCLDKNAKGKHDWIPITIMKTFVLLTATFGSTTTERKRIVALSQ
jgi:hypothetical protein